MEVKVTAAAIVAVLAIVTALIPDSIATVEIVADSETAIVARLELLADGAMLATIDVATLASLLTVVSAVTETAIGAETD